MIVYALWFAALVTLVALFVVALFVPVIWIPFGAIAILALIGFARSRSSSGSTLDAPPGAPGEPEP